MWTDLPLFPPQASTMSAEVDLLYFFLITISGIASVLIAGLLMFFAVRYRRTASVDRSNATSSNLKLEIFWTVVPLVTFMVIFFWSASIYFQISRPPDNAMEIQVVGKRWMWKLQHLTGRREINSLHVPVGRPVKLIMTSEDVIHSFYVPAFRVKADVLPGKYTSTWFEATRPGRYHLFCAEYCGAKHSRMGGWVTVMEPDDFQVWLSGENPGESPVVAGEKLFQGMGCVTCHNETSRARGPDLTGVYGTEQVLQSGETVVADAEYLRESIVNPRAKMVKGYDPLMPTYQGLISEEGILQIIEYLKSIGPEAGAGAKTAPAEAAAGPAERPSATPATAPDTPAALTGERSS